MSKAYENSYRWCFSDAAVSVLITCSIQPFIHLLYLFPSAWQSVPIACSPPSSSIAFSTILECEEKENTTLNRFGSVLFLVVRCILFSWFLFVCFICLFIYLPVGWLVVLFLFVFC